MAGVRRGRSGADARSGDSGKASPTRHKAKGEGRIRQILQVARMLFATEGYSGFTMRAVAGRVGMKLGNLQHYYKTREQLLQAVLEHVMFSYDGHYLRLPGAQNGSTQKRFIAIIRFLIEDLKNPLTSGTFMELWALAERNKFAAEIMDKMYTHHRENIAALLKGVNPRLTAKERARRAALIATQIEGLNLLLARGKPKHAELKGLEDAAVRWMTRMATES